MSLLSNLFGSKKVQFILDGNSVIEIDATTQQTHGRDNTATQFEVEDGSTIGDHLILKPFTLKFEGIISDTPLSLLNALLTTAVSAVAPPAGVVAASAGVSLVSAILGSKSPSVKAYEQLLDLQSKRQPLEVITSLRKYENMFITNLSVPRDSSTGKVLQFTIDLQEIRIVSPVSVLLQIFKNSDLSSGEADQGKKDKNSALVDEFNRGQSDFGRAVGH